MPTRLLPTCLLLCATWFPTARGQAQTGAPAAPDAAPAKEHWTEAERQLDATIAAVQQTLRTAVTYRTTIDSRWKTVRGTAETRGGFAVTLAVALPQKLRLEIQSVDQPAAGLVAVADGASLTRFSKSARQYHRTPTDQPRSVLEDDETTLAALRTAGIDFLVQSDVRGTIWSQLQRVEDLGVTEEAGRQLHTFVLTMVSGQRVDVVFETGARTLPVRVTKRTRIPVAAATNFDMEVDARLTWELAPPLAAEVFQFVPPADAQEVAAEQADLEAPARAAILGQAAPELPFRTLAEERLTLADFRGSSVAVLYFWATWAAPSADRIPELQQFVRVYSERGVKFLAVNVGQTTEAVEAFLTAKGYQGTVVRDPKAESLAALHLTALPAVVVVATDGRVVAIHQGTGPQVLADTQRALDDLRR